MNQSTTLHLEYFAVLREKRGLGKEDITSSAKTPRELYAELSVKYHFSLPEKEVKVAVNDEFSDWNKPLQNGDRVVFIPPVSGG
ncbi:MAG: MoaD/ThiS family protein [Spirochaetia bacterium]|nr:MoaD/ThiS family protein [Spirochaetia bacterium]